MSSQKRKYEMRARAQQQEATRLRITESAVELHGTIGPARTSMSAVAERAGVPRSTLYRHFPDEQALFLACSSHWAARHPLPELDRWAKIESLNERLGRALDELYAYYEESEPMLSNVLRDVEIVPAVQQALAPFALWTEQAHAILLEGGPRRGQAGRQTRAAIGHATSFATWRSLAREQRCSRADAVELMASLVRGVR